MARPAIRPAKKKAKSSAKGWKKAIKADTKRREAKLSAAQKRANRALEFVAEVYSGVAGPQGVRAKGRQLRRAQKALDYIKGAGTTKGGRVKRGTFIKKVGGSSTKVTWKGDN